MDKLKPYQKTCSFTDAGIKIEVDYGYAPFLRISVTNGYDEPCSEITLPISESDDIIDFLQKGKEWSKEYMHKVEEKLK